MNDKFKRVIATGLLTLMIGNLTACDDSKLPNFNDANKDNSQTTTTSSDVTTNQQNPQPVYPPVQTRDLPGDVWKAMKANGKAYATYTPTSSIGIQAIPLQFLQEEGLIYYNDNNELCVIGNQPTVMYHPLYAKIYIDKNTEANDVYVILNYQSELHIYDSDENVLVTTWKLKYTLDDDDYEALLKLKGDFRQRFFIQEMDLIYEPEVISKATTTQRIVFTGSPFNKDSIFPYVYVDSYDLQNKTVTYAVRTNNGYAFYDVSIYESSAIEQAMERWGVTREEVLEHIEMEVQNTALGPTLTSFKVAGYNGGLSKQQVAEAVKNSTRVHILEDMESDSTENQFEAAR